jgi:hypothetical protein
VRVRRGRAEGGAGARRGRGGAVAAAAVAAGTDGAEDEDAQRYNGDHAAAVRVRQPADDLTDGTIAPPHLSRTTKGGPPCAVQRERGHPIWGRGGTAYGVREGGERTGLMSPSTIQLI